MKMVVRGGWGSGAEKQVMPLLCKAVRLRDPALHASLERPCRSGFPWAQMWPPLYSHVNWEKPRLLRASAQSPGVLPGTMQPTLVPEESVLLDDVIHLNVEFFVCLSESYMNAKPKFK